MVFALLEAWNSGRSNGGKFKFFNEQEVSSD